MWGTNKNNQVKSDFFEGINFISKCMGDFFGKLLSAVKKTNYNIEKLNVPKVVVIGSESSGKSSLLENIVKCQLFPKNTTFCTKIPIHLILKGVNEKSKISYQLIYKSKTINTTKDNIYNEIEKIMNEINNTIIDDCEIIVIINEINMIDFEFYDLPGIRAYPQDLNEKTTNLAKKYLSMENVIPICVIPSTTPRITSYIPMALIKEYKKESDTIICLTMCDRLQDENIEELLINRISMTTDEYDSKTFSGICGIINRTHRNNIKLTEQEQIENEWFKQNIYDNMPVNYEYKNSLLKNLGINNLVSKLSSSYKKYVDEKWIPSIICKINEDIKNLESKLEHLGFDPNELENKKIFKKIYKNVQIENFRDYIINVMNSYSFIFESEIQNIHTLETFINKLPINNICVDKEDYIDNLKNYIDDKDKYDNIYETFIINIERFDDLNKCMVQIINNELKQFNATFMSKYTNLIEYDYLTCGEIKYIYDSNKINNFKLNNLFSSYILEFSDKFLSLMKNEWPENLKQVLNDLKETTKEEREKIKIQIKNNHDAINELKEIKVK